MLVDVDSTKEATNLNDKQTNKQTNNKCNKMKNTHTLCGLLLSFEKLSVNLPMGGTAGGS